MKISIITPSFNHDRFIEATINSVLSQTYQDFDYYIVDGGSTDQTITILEKYAKEYSKLSYVSEPDRGQAHAINKGLLATDGDIIAWINSDDLYLPNTLEIVIHTFINCPQVLAIYGQGNHIDEEGDFLEPYPVEPWNYKRLLQTCYLCQPSVFFRRSLVEACGLLNESFHYSLDYEYWLRCGQKFEFFYIPQVLASSRVYATTKTLSNRPQVFYESSLAAKIHSGKVPDRWLLGHAFVTAETQTEGLVDHPNSQYDRLFFRKFLRASLKNYQFWKQWPSVWGLGKLLYWFFRCYQIIR